jgi:hypothetical protein
MMPRVAATRCRPISWGKQAQYLTGDRDEAAEEVVLQLKALIVRALPRTGP